MCYLLVFGKSAVELLSSSEQSFEISSNSNSTPDLFRNGSQEVLTTYVVEFKLLRRKGALIVYNMGRHPYYVQS